MSDSAARPNTHPIVDRLLVALLVIFALAAGTYSVLTPLFEMSDELWHYPMVKTLADGNGLPVQDPANPGPWKQEGSQPPLYYALGAALTAWIDTADVGEVLRPNPHVDNGVITEDGNTNLIAHNYQRERWPWRGTVLAVHLVRFMSVVISTLGVYFTYRVGEELFPDKRWLALAGAATMAFTPMFAFISGAINNDNLAVTLAALSLWLMLRIVREANAGRATWRWAAVLGVALGLAALTKTSTLALIGLAGLAMAYAAWKLRRWQTFFLEGPLIIALAAAIAGWWYLRNLRLYGDPLGLNAFIAILGQRARPASLRQLWGERFGFMQSYWGLFGGVNVPMPGWTYTVLNALAVVSVVGIIVFIVLRWLRGKRRLEDWAPIVLSLLMIAGIVLPLAVSWARITWSSQGRLVFTAISAISLWFMAGLVGWMPERWGKIAGGAVIGLMGALTILAPFLWIAPAYRLPAPVQVEAGGESYDFTPPGADQPALRLLNYELDTTSTEPGGVVRLTLYWESLSPMARNWSTFIHLEDNVDLLAGQRDTYPGVGLIATSELQPGYVWADRYVVPVSPSAYAPEQLDVQVGLYDYESGERMRLPDGGDTLLLGTVTLVARESEEVVPNPVSFNFGGEMELIGYRLDQRQVRQGETMTLHAFWRGLRPMTTNYTISTQVLGPETRIYGQKDSWPLDGALPTAAWTPGELVEDTVQLTVSPDTPPGLYDIQIVVYTVGDEGDIDRLQRVTEDGRLVDDFLLLTQIRVTE
ncbi:MAG: glycosyltransferase family 39 protein [Chloroflexota bacterium]